MFLRPCFVYKTFATSASPSTCMFPALYLVKVRLTTIQTAAFPPATSPGRPRRLFCIPYASQHPQNSGRPREITLRVLPSKFRRTASAGAFRRACIGGSAGWHGRPRGAGFGSISLFHRALAVIVLAPSPPATPAITNGSSGPVGDPGKAPFDVCYPELAFVK